MNPSLTRPSEENGSSSASLIDGWLRQARQGSPSALGRVLESSRKYLLLMANRALDPDLRAKIGASDLVQDTFVEAQRDFRKFTGTTEEELFQWLTAILTHRLANNVRHYRRTRKRSVDRELPRDVVEVALSRLQDASITPAASMLARDDERRVRLALEGLPEPLRDVLIERTWQRDSFAQIGARHNCSAEAARKLWSRAVRQMQKILHNIK